MLGPQGQPYATHMPTERLTASITQPHPDDSRLRLLALLHSPSASGSDTTICRIASHLAALGHSLVRVPDPADPAELARLARKHGADALIGTHAFFSGRSFRGSGLPYVLVLGGTDVNEFAHDPECLEIMTRAVSEATAIVAFNEDFMQRCLRVWPLAEGKLYHIPQGVRTRPSDFSLRGHAQLPPDALIFLLPSGLRPVKDPLFLLSSISQWHRDDRRINLVIAGLAYEPSYHELTLRRIGSAAGVHYVGALAQHDLHAAMREAVAVLNTSLSECSPNAVLEAMDLGCPVMVRDIPGNTCLVRHEVTGLVFGTADDFGVQARRLLADRQSARKIARQGQEFVARAHRLDSERAGYAAVVSLLAGRLRHRSPCPQQAERRPS